MIAPGQKGARVAFDVDCEHRSSDKLSFLLVKGLVCGLYGGKAFSGSFSNICSSPETDRDLWPWKLDHTRKRIVQKLSEGIKLHDLSFSDCFCDTCAENKVIRGSPISKTASLNLRIWNWFPLMLEIQWELLFGWILVCCEFYGSYSRFAGAYFMKH